MIGRFGALVRAILLVLGAVTMAAAPAAAKDANSLPAMADLVAKLLPTVVSVASSRAVPSGSTNGGSSAASGDRRISGSGFIVDPSGLILTNKHVIAGAAHLTVTLQDGTTYRATLVGQAIVSDIALLKIVPMRPLPAVTFADSGTARPGDAVLAIGNPLGLGGSVSSGIVSAIGRDIGGLSPFGDYIQTDAAINHGNSGGPLFDARGRVIGMNTALYSPNPEGGSVGLGFAIPSNDLLVVGGMLREYGRIHAGWIGVHLQRLTPGLANATGLIYSATDGSDTRPSRPGAPPVGVIVVDVDPAGPAAKAGMEAGDVIIGGAGITPTDPRSLEFAIAKEEIGSKSPIVVWRDGHEITLTPIVAEWPSMRGASAPPSDPVEVRMDAPDFGLILAPAGAAERQRYDLTPATGGVLVRDIDPASAAATTELTPGDVVREVQHKVVSTPAEVLQALTQAREGGARYGSLLIDGPGGLRWMALALRN